MQIGGSRKGEVDSEEDVEEDEEKGDEEEKRTPTRTRTTVAHARESGWPAYVSHYELKRVAAHTRRRTIVDRTTARNRATCEDLSRESCAQPKRKTEIARIPRAKLAANHPSQLRKLRGPLK